MVVVVLLEMDYLHKHDKCNRVQKCKGNGLYLAPDPRFVEGDGLFLKHGNYISDGAGLLMGRKSPFKNIPEPFDLYTTLHSLFTALDHQLKDGSMGQQESDRMRFVVRKLWDLKLQIHMIKKEDAQLIGVIGHIITLMLDLHFEGIITRLLFIYVCVHLYTR